MKNFTILRKCDGGIVYKRDTAHEYELYTDTSHVPTMISDVMRRAECARSTAIAALDACRDLDVTLSWIVFKCTALYRLDYKDRYTYLSSSRVDNSAQKENFSKSYVEQSQLASLSARINTETLRETTRDLLLRIDVGVKFSVCKNSIDPKCTIRVRDVWGQKYISERYHTHSVDIKRSFAEGFLAKKWKIVCGGMLTIDAEKTAYNNVIKARWLEQSRGYKVKTIDGYIVDHIGDRPYHVIAQDEHKALEIFNAKIKRQEKAASKETIEKKDKFYKKIFVTFSDSIAAGNCETGTRSFIFSNFDNVVDPKIFKISAFDLLKIKSDTNTRAAIGQAIKRTRTEKRKKDGLLMTSDDCTMRKWS